MNETIFLVNFRNERDTYPPFGIMYAAAALRKDGYQVRLFHPDPAGYDDFCAAVERERPLYVGFSTITGPQLLETVKASRFVKRLGIPVVWGGVHATIMPEFNARMDYIDFVVINEGEETIREFTRHFLSDQDYAGILGLVYKDVHGKVRINPERPFIANLDDYVPAWDLLPSIPRYFIQSGPYSKAIPVYISRGCPFRCGFCYNEVVMRRTWRMHSDEVIMGQIAWLKENYGLEAVDYADDYLFGRPRVMIKLVEKVNMPWSGQVRVHLLARKWFADWLRNSNCQWLNIGAESTSQRLLDLMTKDQRAEDVEPAIANLVGTDIEANISFMIGLPGETEEDRRLTFASIERICEMHPQARCSISSYMPYPGTPLWPEALKHGYRAPDTNEEWATFDLDHSNVPWLDNDMAVAMCEIADILWVGRSQGHWVLSPYYALLRWRWRNMVFKHYWEGRLKRWGGRVMMSHPILRKIRSKVMPSLVSYNAVTHRGPTEALG
jgi:anaerobic magnesium-protoporphyrin IX monomethyl ester cyclase